jgi:hypothetical protein
MLQPQHGSVDLRERLGQLQRRCAGGATSAATDGAHRGHWSEYAVVVHGGDVTILQVCVKSENIRSINHLIIAMFQAACLMMTVVGMDESLLKFTRIEQAQVDGILSSKRAVCEQASSNIISIGDCRLRNSDGLPSLMYFTLVLYSNSEWSHQGLVVVFGIFLTCVMDLHGPRRFLFIYDR